MVDNSVDTNKINMVGGSNLMLRCSIVLGMAVMVVTIFYLTPVPDQNFKSCDRPCHDLEWPMICRVKLLVEKFETNQLCQDCWNNSSNCKSSFCTTMNTTGSIIVANRQLPGPAIHVCHNDILIVDVINRIPDHSVTVHWRGQLNKEAPFMDGVPMVTQCPIPSYTTFQYKIRASSPGTHFYHAFSESDRASGLFGAVVVRQADKVEPHRKLYDLDKEEHAILLSEWPAVASPSSILINGEGPSNPAVFSLKKGRRHRFRLAYASGTVGCPITVSVDNHLVKVIALDGNPINAYEVSSIKLSKGERLDFVLKANQEAGAYVLRARSSCDDTKLDGTAVLSYEGVSNGVTLENKLDLVERLRTFDTSLCDSKIGKVCLADVRSLEKIGGELKEHQVDKRLYISYEYRLVKVEGGLADFHTKIYRANNITFLYPSSPLLTQTNEVPTEMICDEAEFPKRCKGNQMCECIHLEHIPSGSSTELVLIDQAGDQDENIFHLHGNHFYIVGSTVVNETTTKQEIIELDSKDSLLKRNLVNPVMKDTIRIPKNGVVILRFLASNPGFWMLRDEKARSWSKGMDMIFQIGDLGEVVSTPTGFPTCGSFVGPDFFLL